MINYPSTPSDLNDLPYPSNSDVQLFVGEINSGSVTFPNNWKVWRKPRGSTMTYIYAIGGGAGGGGGGQGASGTNKGGGGGGGSGGLFRLIIPSFFLPDILYVSPGNGGIGEPARTVTGVGSAAGAGWISYVSYSPATTGNSVLLQSGAANAAGGTSGGNGAGAGTGGVGSTVSSATVGSIVGIASSSFLAGQAGTAGGTATSNGTDLTTWTTATGFFSGGTGGGGNNNASFTGGNITVAAVVPIQNMIWPAGTGGVVLGGAAGLRGNAGNNMWNPFIKSGGSGGGTNTTTGGDGGNGGIGCGGGGGAAGITAGRGGSGGPGMVLIISW